MHGTMNSKERQHLAELHARFARGTFSETDVSALLILLREKSGGGPIMELAHSIAHSERHSGEFFRRVRGNQSALNDLGKRSGVIDGRHLFSATQFASNLNATLTGYELGELDISIIELIFLCGLSLLQGGSVKGGNTYGELHLVVTSERFELRAKVPMTFNGKTVRVVFALAAVTNRCLPICNPRAHLDALGPVVVKVDNFAPTVAGFKPFEAHIERAPAIRSADVDGCLSVDTHLSRTPEGLLFTPSNDAPMSLRYDGERLSVAGRPEFFRSGSHYEAVLKALHQQLGGCMHDEAGAHWFLPLAVAPDGFHCHWVGRGTGTCTRPM